MRLLLTLASKATRECCGYEHPPAVRKLLLHHADFWLQLHAVPCPRASVGVVHVMREASCGSYTCASTGMQGPAALRLC